MFDHLIYSKNDKYKLYDEEELNIRNSINKRLFIEKGMWGIFLIFYIIYFYYIITKFQNRLIMNLPSFSEVLLLLPVIVLLIGLFQIMKRSIYLYKLKLDLGASEENEGIKALYSKFIFKKWYTLIYQVVLVGTVIYNYYNIYNEIVILNVLIILLSVNIIRLLIKLGINKFRLFMVKIALENVIDEIEETGFDKQSLDELLDSQKEGEFLTGTRYTSIIIQLKRLLDKLEEATNKEKSSIHNKTQLITNLSHDLKTPLTSIINSIYILKNEELNEEERIEQINILKVKSNRLKTLIDNLNEVLNSEEDEIILNKSTINLNKVLEDIIDNFSYKFANLNLDVRYNASQEDVFVYIDKDKLIRIFENLLENISKYSLEDTRVYIDIKQVENYVNVSFKNICKDRVEVDKNTLGNRFVKGEKSRHNDGYGLGLSIVKNLTRVQGGKVDIKVEGDLFKVTLQIKN